MIAEEELELATGGRRLVTQPPQRLHQRDRRVAPIEHVAKLHDENEEISVICGGEWGVAYGEEWV